MKFSLQIAARFIRSNKGTKFLSLIPVITIIGIALGITVLIMAISILDGFDKSISEKIINFNAHINISGFSSKSLINLDKTVIKLEEELKGTAKSISPYLSRKVIISKKDLAEGIILNGVDSFTVNNNIKNILTEGNSDLDKNPYGIIIGSKLAQKLNVEIDDNLTIFSLNNGQPPSLSNMPEVEQFKIVGLYESGMAEYDDINAYISFNTASNFFETNNEVTGYNINLFDISKIDSVRKKLDEQFSYPFYVRSYRDINKHIFTWIELQQKPIPIVLGLIIIVAIFNIVGALLMLVIQKTEAIGIMKSLGAKNKQVIWIFIFEGLFLAGVGILIGNLLAFTLSFIQLNYKLFTLPSEIYYLSSVPISIEWQTYLLISVAGIILAFLASFIPSYIASRLQPIKAIKFD